MDLFMALLHQRTLAALPANASPPLIFLHDKIHFKMISILFRNFHGQDPALFEQDILEKMADLKLMGKLKGRALQELLADFLLLETNATSSSASAVAASTTDEWPVTVTYPTALLKYARKPVGQTEQEWYRSLLEWLILNHKMGSVSSLTTVKEAKGTPLITAFKSHLRDALESIFPSSEIVFHFRKDAKGRAAHLLDILTLTRGVRLFHQSAQQPAQQHQTTSTAMTTLLAALHSHSKASPLVKSEVAYPLLRSISALHVQAENPFLRGMLAQMLDKFRRYAAIHESLEHWDALQDFQELDNHHHHQGGGAVKANDKPVKTSSQVQTDTHPPNHSEAQHQQDSYQNRYKAQFVARGTDRATQSDARTFQRAVSVQCYVHGKTSHAQTKRDKRVGTNTSVRALNGRLLTLDLQ